VAEGPMAALEDRPRPGREPKITLEAKAWLVSLACRKAKDLGYPHELRTTRLLARHAREHGPAEGHPKVKCEAPTKSLRGLSSRNQPAIANLTGFKEVTFEGLLAVIHSQ
jgi:hypothetical protein